VTETTKQQKMMNRFEQEMEKRYIRPSQWNWYNMDYSRYRITPATPAAVHSSQPNAGILGRLFGSGERQSDPADLWPEKRVFGVQWSEWGKGRGENTPSDIWFVGHLLNKLTKIPGTAVAHRLKSPGPWKPEVDHAVIHGSNVYVIDSILSHNGDCGWRTDKKGRSVAFKGHDGWNHTAIANAAEEYRVLLGPHVNVVPLMVISGRTIISGERVSPRGVRLVTTEELITNLGDAIAGGLDTWIDDPAVRRAVIGTVKR
jgi:hypothetical protein